LEFFPGKTVMQFPVSISSTPSGTDESIAEFLVSLEENSPHIGNTAKYIQLFLLSISQISF
jgi:hypothetical protein